jgi:DNA-binding MarR family transcriptional regulator
MESAPPDVEPRWLDDDELDAWRRFSSLLVALSAELDAQMQRRADLSEFEYHVLAGLSEAPDRTMRISALAGFAHGSLSRLSHLLKRLEQRGWVRREQCRSDGRATNAILTDAGYAKVVAAAPIQLEIVRHLVIDALTPTQLHQLGEMSGLMLSRVGRPPDCLQDKPQDCHPDC